MEVNKEKEKIKELLQLAPMNRSLQQIQEIGQKYASFFTNLSLTDKQIEKLGRYVIIKQYKPKQYVYEQGDEGDAYYMIHSGSVAVERMEKQNQVMKKPERVAVLQEGAGFGELALKNGTNRVASVKALEKT